ncbi:MAG: hypothetical protein KAJ62_01265 [Desulfobacteraceae bacterium]|nr:hypothetical protein [Desulfobacteraceae bacterium]
MKNIKKTFKIVNIVFILLVFVLFLSVLIFSGCGKKGPPEMIEKSQEKLKPIENFQYQIKDGNVLLTWESNYKLAIDGFDMYMAKQNIKKCQGCPVVFIKIDFLAPNVNKYQKDLKQGYRYFFKIITSGANNIKSNDSETIKIEFE